MVKKYIKTNVIIFTFFMFIVPVFGKQITWDLPPDSVHKAQRYTFSYDTTVKVTGAQKCALASGYITSLAIIYNFIERPVGLWDFCCKAFCVSLTVGFTGLWISNVYEPIFTVLSDIFSGDDTKNSQKISVRDCLAVLIIEWNKIKTDLPEPLRNKFDNFFQNYEKNGHLTITEEQALIFIKDITQEVNRVYTQSA